MSDVAPCPRCGARSRFLLTPDDRVDGRTTSIRRCESRLCGVGYTEPPPGGQAAAPASSPGGLVQDLVASKIIAAGVAPVVRRLPVGSLVVDIGAGSGLRVRALAQAGMRVIAVEPDAIEEMRAHVTVSALPLAVQRRVEVVRAGVDDLPEVLAGRTAHAAVMWHVLEHLDDMDAALRTVAAAVRPSGLLSLAVPNRASVEAAVFGPRWHGWEPSRHRWHLDQESLRLVLGASGFAVSEVGTRGGWGYPSGLAYSLAPGLDPQVEPRRALLGRALAAAMIPVAGVARVMGRGAQLVTIAQRSERRLP